MEATTLFRNLTSGKPMRMNELYETATEEKRAVPDTSSKKKPKKLSKRELIIRENLVQQQKKQVASDMTKLQAFVDQEGNDFETWLGYMQTDHGRMYIKYHALKKAVKARDKRLMFDLVLQLSPTDFESGNSERKFLDNLHRQFDKMNKKSLQLEILGNRLPPLDFYNRSGFKLDDWQIQVLDYIREDRSVLVCAPTSSGKTILSTYFATLDQRVLYVVPSKPLAFQVASVFHTITGGGVSVFVDDFSYQPDGDCRVMVGTPHEIESKLASMRVPFDLAVFDEIHNLNSDCGACYERLIQWHGGNFMALSATIQNKEELRLWLDGIIPDRTVEVVEYTKRFINIQRHIWNTATQHVERLEPLSCLEREDFQDKSIPISFTPWDCYSMWKSLEAHYGEDATSAHLNPEVWFKDITRISLSDVKQYEEALKQHLVEDLSDTGLDSLLANRTIPETTMTDTFDVLEMLTNIRDADMFPAIAFNTEASAGYNLFETVVKRLEEDELYKYPFHYDNQEYQGKLFLEYQARRRKLEGDTAQSDREHILMRFDKSEISKYGRVITERYKKNLATLQKRVNDGQITEPVAEMQRHGLRKEYDRVISCEDILYTDIFEKHPDFCFTRDPMKAQQIRAIRKTIGKKTGARINYEHVMIQGLKRGIGIYTKDLPDAYVRIVQELAQNRELGVVFSDESLALGINMPFRTTIITGWKGSHTFTPLLYHQMAGRAGRRGMDVEGHVVFANVAWRDIMKGQLEEIRGNSRMPVNYNVLETIYPEFAPIVKRVTEKCLVGERPATLDTASYSELTPSLLCVLWKLREYGVRAVHVANQLDNFEMWVKGDRVSHTNLMNLFTYLIQCFFTDTPLPEDLESAKIPGTYTNLLETFKMSSIPVEVGADASKLILVQVRELGNIVKHMHNGICEEPFYESTTSLLVKAFSRCRQLISAS